MVLDRWGEQSEKAALLCVEEIGQVEGGREKTCFLVPKEAGTCTLKRAWCAFSHDESRTCSGDGV